MTLTYTLRIVAPDGFDIEGDPNYDPDLIETLNTSSDPRDDTLEKQVQRWLGGALDEAEATIDDSLPDGWYASIGDAS